MKTALVLQPDIPKQRPHTAPLLPDADLDWANCARECRYRPRRVQPDQEVQFPLTRKWAFSSVRAGTVSTSEYVLLCAADSIANCVGARIGSGATMPTITA